jgi:hypothetical protein
MAKKLTTHKPIDIAAALPEPTYSPALHRVMQHKRATPPGSIVKPTYEGFFLTNKQIINLGKQLAELKLENSRNLGGFGPDGVCFMVGEVSDADGNVFRSVEVIPYRNKKETEEGFIRKFYKHDGVQGGLPKLELSPATEAWSAYTLDGSGFHIDLLSEGQPHHLAQHTPPPFPE